MAETPTYQPRGLYYEEFEIGKTVVTTSRTVTESHIVSFAALSGDYNQIHTDVEFSKSTPFGQRIAHGLLVLSMASGLIAQLGLIEGTVIAFRELTWKFSKPVFIGDTIHVEMKVTETKGMARIGGGAVTIKIGVKNQAADVVMRGVWVVLIASKTS